MPIPQEIWSISTGELNGNSLGHSNAIASPSPTTKEIGRTPKSAPSLEGHADFN
ncbi:MAG: hypothetical protein AB1589_13040 [Cyanobacteriota bacterium]